VPPKSLNSLTSWLKSHQEGVARLQVDVWQTTGAWALTLLLYPGVVFAALVVLVGEWLVGMARPFFSPRLYRSQTRLYSPLQPLYVFLKLLGRQGAVRWQRPGDSPTAPSHPGETVLSVIGAIAPLLALALLPAGGSPIESQLGAVGDLLILLLLLAVQPVSSALLRLREGRSTEVGPETMNGARQLGRLLAGLLPTLLLAAALVEVSGANTLALSSLTAAPLTAQQTLVRLLAGVALLLALPWWSGWSREGAGTEGSAGGYAGRVVQTVALAAFWTVIALPAPGDTPWAVALFIIGTLFAYTTFKIVSERWAPARREGEATGLLWAATLPAAALALLLALWTGA
jgi:hypothetical protein